VIPVELAKHLRNQAEVANLLSAGDQVKVFLGTVPQGVEFPAVTVMSVGGNPDYTLANGEIADVQKIVQVSVFAPTYLQCEAISEAIRLAISGYSGLFDQTVVHAVLIQSERDATIAPVDSSGRAGWMQSTDYRITFTRSVTAY